MYFIFLRGSSFKNEDQQSNLKIIVKYLKCICWLFQIIIQSVHKGEAFLVLLGLLGGQLLLQVKLLLLVIVVLQGRLNINPASHHGGYAFPQCVDLEVVDRPVEAVDLLGGELPYKPGQVVVDVVPEDVVFELGGLSDVVVHLLQDLEDELEGLLVDVLDGDVGALLDGLGLLDVLHGCDLLLVEVVLLSVNGDK